MISDPSTPPHQTIYTIKHFTKATIQKWTIDIIINPPIIRSQDDDFIFFFLKKKHLKLYINIESGYVHAQVL